MHYRKFVQCLVDVGVGLLVCGCEHQTNENDKRLPAADPQPDGPAVQAKESPARPVHEKESKRWFVRVGDATSAVNSILAIAHSLHEKLPEQRIVSQADGQLLLIAGMPGTREHAEKQQGQLRGILPDGLETKIVECERVDGACGQWEALAISPTFYQVDPLDLPEDSDELRVATIASAHGVSLESVPYYDPNDNDGHTEGFVTRVDVRTAEGTLTLDKRCILAAGSISPAGDKLAVECVRDYVAEIPRFSTTVYRVADGEKLHRFTSCRGTSWGGKDRLVCMGDFVNERGEEIASPKEVDKHLIP